MFIGHRKHGGGVYTMTARSLSELHQYVMLIHASQRLDYYITANTVSGTSRTADGLFGLQNIVINIDCHEDHIDIAGLVQTFLWRAERDMWSLGGISPAPTVSSVQDAVCSSGGQSSRTMRLASSITTKSKPALWTISKP